ESPDVRAIPALHPRAGHRASPRQAGRDLPEGRDDHGEGVKPMAQPDRFLLVGVMGWPIMHSRSPMLHNFWFDKYRLAGTYVPLAIKPEGLPAALRALPTLCFAGCNLTIPHKQAAMTIVDEVDAVGRRIGAISCVVVRPDGTLAGCNND